MKYPYLTPIPENRETVDTFLGYNHQLRIGGNEFYDLMNMSSDNAPVLTTRKNRGVYVEGRNPQGMIAKDSLCWVDGSDFVINEYRIDLGLSTEADKCPKTLIGMGAYVIIMPDRKYVNTAKLDDYGSIDAEFVSHDQITVCPCLIDGTEFTPEYIQPEEPPNPSNMAMWMDTSVKPHSLKQWSSAAGMWSSVVTTYVKIKTSGIGQSFGQYDGVTISGFADIQLEDGEQIKELDGSKIIYAADSDSIVIIGLLDVERSFEWQITVTRKMPEMDFIVEHDNRLWGCHYGMSGDKFVNEIYASKLGDFKNWDCYMGISTDSYRVSLGSDGPFTGAITHAGYPCFFKENVLHKIYGQIPANFSVQNTECRGVQAGCSRSMAIVNEILYYKARHAICSYDGSLPVEVSTELGEESYREAIGSAHANKYYCSMENTATGERSLFVFDTARKIWMREDDPNPIMLCSCRDELYCACKDGSIITMLGSGDQYEMDFDWMAETGLINASGPDRAYLKRISVRMILEPGSSMDISAQYDSVPDYEPLAHLMGTDLRSFDIPVRPRRCDHLRLRMTGSGKAMILSITKTMSGGSEKT